MTPRPDPASGPVLGDLLEEIDVRVEEEREPGREVVDVHPARHARLHVGDAVGEREGQLLRGRRARLADVVAAYAYGVPARHLLRARTHEVGDYPHRGPRREYPGLLGDVFLEDVVLDGAAHLVEPHALPLAVREVEAEQDAAGPLMVIDVVMAPGSMPSNSACMSRSESIATPQRPTSPWVIGSSESCPMMVGMSNATESPVWPFSSRKWYRWLVSRAVPKPENWRIVHRRPRYMFGCTPRVKGYSPRHREVARQVHARDVLRPVERTDRVARDRVRIEIRTLAVVRVARLERGELRGGGAVRARRRLARGCRGAGRAGRARLGGGRAGAGLGAGLGRRVAGCHGHSSSGWVRGGRLAGRIGTGGA